MTYAISKTYYFLIGFCLAASLNAQSDVLLKTDGQEMEGKVTAMEDEYIKFVYKNETLEYTIPKKDILKITYVSGRVEFFHKQDSPTFANARMEDHHNKVAILPFGFIKDQETSNPAMVEKIQEEAYTIFKNKATALQFQDPSTTNALLQKAGVKENNIKGYTMGEICTILGVEYVVQGLVSIEATSVTNSSSTSKQTKSSGNQPYVDKNGNIVGDIWNQNKSSSNTTTFSIAQQNYSTNITMKVYTDKGDNIFSKDHESFWQTQDAYKITLNYLAKRTPIYKR